MKNLPYLCFSLLIHISFCYIKMPVLTAAGEIWDLYAYNDIRDILALAEDWLVVPYQPYASQKVSFCNTYYFLGGAGISSSVGFFERTYTNLPTHSLAYYSFPVQMIGIWSLSDSFSIIIDGVTLSTWTILNYPASICGLLDVTKSVGGKIAHSASSLTLRISFNIQSNNLLSPASLIVKDVYFSFRNSTETAISVKWISEGCPSGSLCSCTSNCQVCFASGTTQCARCDWGKSDYGSGCGTCPANCLLCSGSASNQCALCDTGKTVALDGTCQSSCPSNSVTMTNGRYSFCIAPCPAGQFMMWNWTCGASCDVPLTQTASSPTPYCNYPCNQQSGEYLYWDGTCSSTCPFTQRNESWYFFCDACPQGYWSYQNTSCLPSCQLNFVQTTVGGSDFCTYPCSSSQFLYPNGSCISNCQLNFRTRIEGTFKFCDYPCLLSQFLYPNGTCQSACQAQFRTRLEGSFQFCDYPCLLTEFLYPNNTCMVTCQTSFSQRTEGLFKFCDYPCELSAYLYPNLTCKSYCQDQFKTRMEGAFQFCDYPCQFSQFLFANGSCISSCQTTFSQRIEGSFKFCDYPCPLSQYLYTNATCKTYCQDLFSVRTEGSFQFCDYPCQITEFLYQNRSCLPTCQLNFLQRTESSSFQFCTYPCSATEFLYPNGTCQSICQAQFTTRIEGSYQFCDYPCLLAEFLYPNGTCMATCQTAFSQRIEGSFRFCDYPCALSDYLYPNATCKSYCQILFSTRTEGSFHFCDYPCQSSEFLYQNTSCLLSCQLNFLQRTEGSSFQFCTFPCPASQFLYPNGTCLPSCQALFTPRTEGSFQFCDYPCQITEFLYQNQSCLPTCQDNFLQRLENSYQFCTYPCSSSQYLYQNGSCLPTCQPLFNIRIENTFQFCDFPCAPNEFLYLDGSCNITCKKYYLQRTEQTVLNFCDYPCTKPGYWLAEDGSCVTTPTLSNGTQAVLAGSQKTSAALRQAAGLLTSGSAISISASFAGRIFFNIKYLNISYSEELQEALETWSQSFISEGITPNLPAETIKKIPARPVPHVFEKYGVSSSFLLNFWESLCMLILILITLASIRIFEVIINYFKKANTFPGKLIKKSKIMVQNFFIATIYGVYGDLVLYSIIEYRTIQFNFDISLLSFIISVLLLIIMAIGFLLHFLLLTHYQALKKRSTTTDSEEFLENFTKRYPGLQVLYRDFSDKSLDRQILLIRLSIRDILFSGIITTLFDFPLVQVTLFGINSFFFIFALIDRRPYRSKFDLVQQFYFELIGLSVNGSVLLNSVNSNSRSANSSIVVKRIGRFIIAMNMVYNFSVAGLMFLQIFLLVQEQWRDYRLKKKNAVIRIRTHTRLNESTTTLNPVNIDQSVIFPYEQLQIMPDLSVSGSINSEENPLTYPRGKRINLKRRRIL